MNEIGKNIAKGLFYLVATVLILWTSSLTVTFVQNALPNTFFLVPYLALVVFDGGMIAWLFVFLRYAQGAGQRATAIVTCLLDFLGVGLMVIAEILLGGQTLTAAPANLGTYAIWGIGAWTVINVLSVLVFHITDPEAIKQMSLQNEKDEIWRGALKQLASMRAQNSSRLHEEIGRRLYQDMLAELDVNGNGIPDKLEEKPASPPAPKRPSNIEWINELNGHQTKHQAAQSPGPLPTKVEPIQNGRSVPANNNNLLSSNHPKREAAAKKISSADLDLSRPHWQMDNAFWEWAKREAVRLGVGVDAIVKAWRESDVSKMFSPDDDDDDDGNGRFE